MVNRGVIIANGAALGVAAAAYEMRKRSRDELIALAEDIDAKSFNNWLWFNGVRYTEIAAMWLTESSGNPRATNMTGGDGAQGGSWGLGQVTARTATDYGLAQPLAPLMLFPRIGAKISIAHVRAVVRGLRANGLQGGSTQWVQAYNVGLTGFLNGRRNVAHHQRFLTHLV